MRVTSTGVKRPNTSKITMDPEYESFTWSHRRCIGLQILPISKLAVRHPVKICFGIDRVFFGGKLYGNVFISKVSSSVSMRLPGVLQPVGKAE